MESRRSRSKSLGSRVGSILFGGGSKGSSPGPSAPPAWEVDPEAVGRALEEIRQVRQYLDEKESRRAEDRQEEDVYSSTD